MTRSELIAARDESLAMLLQVYRKVVEIGLPDDEAGHRCVVYSETHKSLCQQIEQLDLGEVHRPGEIDLDEVCDILDYWGREQPDIAIMLSNASVYVRQAIAKGGAS